MINIFILLLRHSTILIKYLRPVLKYVYFIFSFLWKVAKNPATFFIVALWPLLEVILKLFTGWEGLLSPIIDSFIMYMWSMVMNWNVEFFDISSAYTQMNSKALEILRYLGISQGVQRCLNGLVSITIIWVNLRIAIYLTKIKYALILKDKWGRKL